MFRPSFQNNMKKFNLGLLFITFIAIIAIALYGARKAPEHTSSQKNIIVVAPTKTPLNTVIISDYKYLPKKIIIKKGTTITWVNKDIAKHTITADTDITNGPNSQFFGKDGSYKFTFNTLGTFAYHCEPHPYMKAVVEVTE